MTEVNSNAVSVVLPILNEELYLESAVKSILLQDFNGDLEIILAVGPSRDKTLEIANNLAGKDSRIKVVENTSGRTAAGLNIAIKHSKYPIIVRVDGHAKIPDNYISIAVELLNQLNNDPHKDGIENVVNVGGLMAAEGVTAFERSVARAMRSPLGVGGAKFHTGGIAGLVDTVYLGVFKKDALLAVGGFDEHFTRAQDWELNYRLRSNGGKVYFDPRLVVTYRPRRSLIALAKQYFEYGRWRRVVTRTHKGTINYRYLAPPLTFLGVTFSLFGATFNSILAIPALVYGSFLVLAAILIGKGLLERLYLPFVLLTMQMSWGVGFLTSRKNLAKS